MHVFLKRESKQKKKEKGNIVDISSLQIAKNEWKSQKKVRKENPHVNLSKSLISSLLSDGA